MVTKCARGRSRDGALGPSMRPGEKSGQSSHAHPIRRLDGKRLPAPALEPMRDWACADPEQSHRLTAARSGSGSLICRRGPLGIAATGRAAPPSGIISLVAGAHGSWIWSTGFLGGNQIWGALHAGDDLQDRDGEPGGVGSPGWTGYPSPARRPFGGTKRPPEFAGSKLLRGQGISLSKVRMAYLIDSGPE